MLYGTAWKKDKTSDLVTAAFRLGFRGVDTACQPKHYQEPLVGDALRDMLRTGVVKRDEVWIQTKFTSVDGQDPNRIPYDPRKSPPDQARESIEVSRKNLGVEVIDSWVLHSPMRGGFDKTLEVWKAMEEAVDEGKVQFLGISNCYKLDFFTRLYQLARHKPLVLQNRFYSDSGWDNELRQFCLDHSILYQSFWTLSANPDLLGHRVTREIAEKYSITQAQVLYKFLVDVGHQPLTGCKTEQHVVEAVDVRNLDRFTVDELNAIKKLIGDKNLFPKN